MSEHRHGYVIGYQNDTKKYEGRFFRCRELEGRKKENDNGSSGGERRAGGGDTVAVIRELGLEDQFGFLSTGGGAMLDVLVDGELPGVDALIQSR